MVRYVPIEETVILIMCIRKSYEKNTQHKRQIGRCNCILSQKKYKITTCASANAIGGIFIPDYLTDSEGIGGGTGCNFIFFYIERASLSQSKENFFKNISEVSLIYI